MKTRVSLSVDMRRSHDEMMMSRMVRYGCVAPTFRLKITTLGVVPVDISNSNVRSSDRVPLERSLTVQSQLSVVSLSHCSGPSGARMVHQYRNIGTSFET